MSQKKEYFNLFNTLACIPSLLLNRNVLVFMRNETWVAGKITNADGFMNIWMESVVYCDQKGLQYRLDNYALRYRQILYIQISESINITTAIENYMKHLHKPATSKKHQPHTFKKKRAMLSNQRTADEHKTQ